MKLFWLIIFLLFPFTLVSSDQGSEYLAREISEQNGDSVKDPRLPPTIPGEQMVVGGKKVKVTSTTGPVTVAQPPEPWEKGQKQDIKDIFGSGAVVVDQRSPRDSSK